tara:strand:+ start:22708 stop:23649 length:942 start_codon:yes stop_codon:yes gene_type:complete
MILITGGSGYLGARLAKFLTEVRGQKVIIGLRRNSSSLIDQIPNCEFETFDLTDQSSLDDLLKGVSHVIHLAALNAQQSFDDPNLAERVNVEGSSKVVKASIKNRVKRIIYFSTAHVYSSPLKGLIEENITPQNDHPYAITHLKAEHEIKKLLKGTMTKHTIFRLSNAVGAPLIKETNCWMLVINDIVKQLIEKDEIVFTSDRKTERDYIAISEICEVVNQVISDENERYEGMFNLGSGTSLSLESIAELVSKRAKKILNKDITITFPKDAIESDFKLNFSINKINNTGIRIMPDLTKEIDHLLIKSKQWFNP